MYLSGGMAKFVLKQKATKRYSQQLYKLYELSTFNLTEEETKNGN